MQKCALCPSWCHTRNFTHTHLAYAGKLSSYLPRRALKEENKGYCWILFQSIDDAETAIEKINNLNYCGRKLEVRWN